MPAGIGASGYLALTFETAVGTYLPPTTAGTVFIPILSETLDYKETKYYSEQIRQSTVASEQKPGYYSVSGDIVFEVDTAFLPYLMYCSRHTITKTGASPPYVYKFTPSNAGSPTTAASGAVARTASMTVVRNGIGFGYGGCVVTQYAFTIDNGNLRCTASVMGLSEATPGGLGSPVWVAAKLLGADAHSIYLDSAGTAPGFAGGIDTSFNGYTFTTNYNGTAQNRIVPARAATYISYGETVATYDTQLDFLSKTDYNNMKASAKRAIRLESIGDATTFALSNDAVRIDVNNSVFDTYAVELPGLADLVMATASGRALGIAGGDPYAISVASSASIT